MSFGARTLFFILILPWTHMHGVCLGQTILPETCDASAVLRLANGDLLIGDDESNVLRRYDEHSNIVSETDLSPFIGDDEADIEGVAVLGELAFWITSHGRNRKGKLKQSRYRLFATSIPGNEPNSQARFVGQTTMLAGAMVDPERWSDPKTYGPLITQLRQATELTVRKVKRLAPKRAGLNIEGLTRAHDGGLLMGLRNPLIEGKAVVLRLQNPQAVLNGSFPQFGAASLLDLGGRGIRGMVTDKGRHLLIAGPVDGGARFALYSWSGDVQAPAQMVKEMFAQPGINPEGIELSPGGILIANDEGSRMVDGRRCKDVAAPFRSFSVQTLDIKSRAVPSMAPKPTSMPNP